MSAAQITEVSRPLGTRTPTTLHGEEPQLAIEKAALAERVAVR
ncbi:MAG TPA: hypothetical protein VIJ15_10445 [Dermatophilaceae bacterium]